MRSVFRPKSVLIVLGGSLFGVVLGAMFVAALAVQFFDYQIVRVQTGSMQPSYSQGDLVIVRPVKAADIEQGDVILFTANTGSSVMHRVIGVNTINTNIEDQQGNLLEARTEKRFVTQGDANPVPDIGDVSQTQVQGAVWFSVPGLGGTDEFTMQAFLLAAAGLIVVGWIGYEGFRFSDRRSKRKNASRQAQPTTGLPPDEET